eukprot:20909-Eustigmatos_ZCMA.PRE.1
MPCSRDREGWSSESCILLATGQWPCKNRHTIRSAPSIGSYIVGGSGLTGHGGMVPATGRRPCNGISHLAVRIAVVVFCDNG